MKVNIYVRIEADHDEIQSILDGGPLKGSLKISTGLQYGHSDTTQEE